MQAGDTGKYCEMDICKPHRCYYKENHDIYYNFKEKKFLSHLGLETELPALQVGVLDTIVPRQINQPRS